MVQGLGAEGLGLRLGQKTLGLRTTWGLREGLGHAKGDESGNKARLTPKP